MTSQVQILIDRDVYDQLQLLMVPPISDANAAIRELLKYDGRALAEAGTHHFSFEQELERSRQGIYEGGGCT